MTVRGATCVEAVEAAGGRAGLYSFWLDLKRQEEEAALKRRMVEMRLTEHLPEQWEGSKTETDGDFKVTVVRRFTRKVDSDMLQDAARQHGMEEYLPELFRWKPEIDAKRWKNAPENVTSALSCAIVTTPGKASVKIENIKEEN